MKKDVRTHPRSCVSREKLIRAINEGLPHMDVRQLMKLYAFAHRMMRDKVK